MERNGNTLTCKECRTDVMDVQRRRKLLSKALKEMDQSCLFAPAHNAGRIVVDPHAAFLRIIPCSFVVLRLQRNPSKRFASVENAIRTGSDSRLQTAFERRESDFQIEGRGVVAKVLPDDNKGSRHQRFILRLNSGQTVLVAHNIDLAPQIKGLKKGDEVAFYGEYEWSGQGGVIHWTHRDPQGRHPDGWLKHEGEVYR